MEEINQEMEDLACRFYPLAFCLCPDDLMATQLIIDSIARWGLSQSSLESWDEDLEVEYVFHLYELARLRSKHFAFKKTESFFKLSLQERFLLYLRDKLSWDYSTMARACGERPETTIAQIHQARSAMVSNLKLEKAAGETRW